MNDRRPSRRQLLYATASAVGLAGCTAADLGLGNEPRFEDGTIEVDDVPRRNATELSAAADLADQESHERVTPLKTLTIADHEFVLEDDLEGPTIQGTVDQQGRVEAVEVRARVYNDRDVQLGRYLDSTGDLGGGQSWAFTVIVLEEPADLASYDVAVLGTPT